MKSRYRCKELMTKAEKRKRVLIKLTVFMVIVAVICGVVLFHFKSNIYPIVLDMSEARVRAMSVRAMNSAAQSVIGQNYGYNDIVTIEKDANGKITMIQTNTTNINKAVRELSTFGQSNIDQLKEQYIELPLGAFTGSVVLAGMGPKIKITMIPIGAVDCEIVSVFDSAGINQTRHSIYINMSATVNIILPVSDADVLTTTPILLCESIIVGEIPEVYLNSSGGGKILDLIP